MRVPGFVKKVVPQEAREALKLSLRRARHRLRLIWHRRLRGRERTDPVFIISTARCGSTLLDSRLDSLPEVSLLIQDGITTMDLRVEERR